MKNPYLKFYAVLLMATLAGLATSCDPFQSDEISADKEVTIDKKDLYALSNSSTVIDVNSLLTSYSNVNLEVKDKTASGSLSQIGNGSYRYEPKSNFMGNDYFSFSIHKNGSLWRRDSICIHVKKDTTQFPCGIYAVADSIYVPSNGSAQIDFLANDVLCGTTRSNIKSVISTPPQHGQAQILNNGILKYTFNGAYRGADSLVYKISKRSNPSEVSYGFVRIGIKSNDSIPSCKVYLRNDSAIFSNDSLIHKWKYNVFLNDTLCSTDSSLVSLSITQQPSRGSLSKSNALGVLEYQKFSAFTATYTDSAEYQVCYKGSCFKAMIKYTFIYKE